MPPGRAYLSAAGAAGTRAYWRECEIEGNYNLLLPAFFALAHLALARAESLALAAADIFRLGFSTRVPAFRARTLAHLAFAAARMLASPCALILRFLGFLGASVAAVSPTPPRSCPSRFWSDWILSWMLAAVRSCCGVKLIIVVGVWMV